MRFTYPDQDNKIEKGHFLLMFYAIIIVLFISIDKSNIRTKSLRNTHSQETQHLSWETL
jgi:uncharacterized DUF497 family protein